MRLVKSKASFWFYKRRKELAPCQGPFALYNSVVKGVVFISPYISMYSAQSQENTVVLLRISLWCTEKRTAVRQDCREERENYIQEGF